MRKALLSFLLFIIVYVHTTLAAAQKTHVFLLPTIHRLHASNEKYSYSNLLSLISNYKPDIIALEIRPEDMEQDTSYLKKLYPPEMIMVRDTFHNIKKVGIDDYGMQARGKLLNPEIFKDSTLELGRYKLEERRMSADSSVIETRMKEGIPEIINEQIELAKKSNAQELLDGRYDKLTEDLYHKLDAILVNSPYRFYNQFNTARDIKIATNIEQLIKSNRGKRIIVLTGVNHHNRAEKVVRNMTDVVLHKSIQ